MIRQNGQDGHGVDDLDNDGYVDPFADSSSEFHSRSRLQSAEPVDNELMPSERLDFTERRGFE